LPSCPKSHCGLPQKQQQQPVGDRTGCPCPTRNFHWGEPVPAACVRPTSFQCSDQQNCWKQNAWKRVDWGVREWTKRTNLRQKNPWTVREQVQVLVRALLPAAAAAVVVVAVVVVRVSEPPSVLLREHELQNRHRRHHRHRLLHQCE
jgi:hypothetical protein